MLSGSPQAVIAVTSTDSNWNGGHAVIYAEWAEGQDVCCQKFHLLNTGGNLSIRTDPIERNTETEFPPRHVFYRSWAVDPIKVIDVQTAVIRFRNKVNNGRYVYNHHGGLIGRISTGHGVRGVNCADFCVKILTEARVGNLVGGLFTIPVSLTGRSLEAVY